MKITLSAVNMQSGNLPPQDNPYLPIGRPSDGVVEAKTGVGQAKVVGSVVYEGLKTVVKGLYDCSDIFLPLKTAAGGILTIINFVEVCVSMYNNTDSRVIIIYSRGSEGVGQ